MENKKGISLVEIIVCLIIIGIAAAIIVPNIVNSIEQTKAQAAKNNLLAISAAQQKYFEDNNSAYCVLAGCGDTTANLYGALGLNITTNDPFTYTCAIPNPAPVLPAYICTATDGTVTLTTTGIGVNCTVGGAECPS